MIKSTKLFTAFLAIVLSIAFTGCKDDDPQPALEYKTEGFIKGKITGMSKDNSYTFNDEFNFTEYSLIAGEAATVSTYSINNDGSYEVSISRASYDDIGFARISFELSNATDTTPDDLDFNITYTKELNDKFISFTMSDNGDNTFAITDFTFDATTGKVKGKYTISGIGNSTNKNASVAGEFEVTAKKVIQ